MSTDPNSLAEPLRGAVLATIADARAQGASVVVVSARRTRDEQIALRRANCGPTDYDVFEKPSGECKPETAQPGKSKHERGAAVDIGGDVETFAKLGAPRGLTRPVRGEPWHFEMGNSGAPSPDGGSVVGAVAGVVTAPVAGVLGGLDALRSLAGAVTNPTTWLRLAGGFLGIVLLFVGVAVLGLDLSGVKLGREDAAGLAAAGAVA